MATQLHQQCTVIPLHEGIIQFNVISRVQNLHEGDLPFAEIFVYDILDKQDPKKDVFVRVGNLVDITTLIQGRTNAVLAKATKYLSNLANLSFDDLDSATTAKQLLQARVDRLINDWIKYTNSFISPDSIDLPTISSTLVTAAKAVYYAALAAKNTAANALATAVATLTLAIATSTAKNSQLLDLQANNDNFLEIQSLTNAVVLAITTHNNDTITFLAAAATFRNSSYNDAAKIAFDNARAAYDIAYSVYIINLAQLNAAQSRISDVCDTLSSSYASALVAKQNADIATAAAQTVVSQSQATATVATQHFVDAEAALLAVCPDFEG